MYCKRSVNYSMLVWIGLWYKINGALKVLKSDVPERVGTLVGVLVGEYCMCCLSIFLTFMAMVVSMWLWWFLCNFALCNSYDSAWFDVIPMSSSRGLSPLCTIVSKINRVPHQTLSQEHKLVYCTVAASYLPLQKQWLYLSSVTRNRPVLCLHITPDLHDRAASPELKINFQRGIMRAWFTGCTDALWV